MATIIFEKLTVDEQEKVRAGDDPQAPLEPSPTLCEDKPRPATCAP